MNTERQRFSGTDAEVARHFDLTNAVLTLVVGSAICGVGWVGISNSKMSGYALFGLGAWVLIAGVVHALNWRAPIAVARWSASNLTWSVAGKERTFQWEDVVEIEYDDNLGDSRAFLLRLKDGTTETLFSGLTHRQDRKVFETLAQHFHGRLVMNGLETRKWYHDL